MKTSKINPHEQYWRAEALRRELDKNISSQNDIHYIDTYNTAIEVFKLPLTYPFATTSGNVDACLCALRQKAMRTVQDTQGKWWTDFSTPNMFIQAQCAVEWGPQTGINLYRGFVRDLEYTTNDVESLTWLDKSHIHVVRGWQERHRPQAGASPALERWVVVEQGDKPYEL